MQRTIVIVLRLALVAVVIGAACFQGSPASAAFEQANRLAANAGGTATKNVAQTYYVPLPEDQLLTINSTIAAAAVNPQTTYISIVVPAAGTLVYFDQWENGFDEDITHPLDLYNSGNTDGTQIWGDGDLTNGAAPGITGDVFAAGSIVTLSNTVQSGTRQTVIDYDGGDKYASSLPIAMTRVAWSAGSGTLMATSQQMMDTSVWGTSYSMPVGTGTLSARQVFEFAGAAVMASEPGTVVQKTSGGTTTTLGTIGEGQSLLATGLLAGDVITANNPVQVTMHTGDIGSTYESRTFPLYPTNLLSSSYYNPVNTATTTGTLGTVVLLHNPNSSAITVKWETNSGSGVTAQTDVAIAARSTNYVTMPTPAAANAVAGARFYTTGSPAPVFSAVGAVDAVSTTTTANQTIDWGYTLVPTNQLTKQALVGFGPGQDPTMARSENTSPVWVNVYDPNGQPASTYKICVDWKGDGVGSLPNPDVPTRRRYDVEYTLGQLQVQKITNPNAGDPYQTGTLVYICDETSTARIAVAWGEDNNATGGSPGLDCGNVIPPLPDYVAVKNAVLTGDLSGNGRFDPNDTFRYDIKVTNTGALPVPANNITVSDVVPAYTSYVAGSTYFNDGTTDTLIPDAVTGTPFPLDEGGYTIPVVLPVRPTGVFTIKFSVKIDGRVPNGLRIQNQASVSGVNLTFAPVASVPINLPGAIGNRVWLDENGNGRQDAGEPGLANVTVQLWNSDHTSVIDSAVTDANGYYLITGLDSTNGVVVMYYQAEVLASSLPAGLVTTAVPGGSGDFINHAQPYPVTTGAESLTADFGYNWAPSGDTTGVTGTGAIGDRVWIDADGDGTQDPGELGLAGVGLILYSDGNNDGVYDTQVATATTGSSGSYIFDNIAAGSYVVAVNPATLPVGYTQTGDPDAAMDQKTTRPVVLAPGDVFVRADFGYHPAAASTVSGRVWFDTNASGGSGPDASEGGIGGVTVSLVRDLDQSGTYNAGDVVVAAKYTATDGTYSFAGVPAGRYLVWVNDADQLLESYRQTADPNGAPLSDVYAFNANGVDPAANLNFGYTDYYQQPARGLIGTTVYIDRNNNNAFDPGEGVQDVPVKLYNAAGTLVIAATTTDANGGYAFGDLASGTYQVRVDSSALGGGVSNTVDPDGGNDSRSTVTLTAGALINLDQDFGYQGANTISGTLWNDLNANGALNAATETGRYANVTVALLDAGGSLMGTTTTDGSGSYSFGRLPDGDYKVRVTDLNGVLAGLWKSAGAAPGTDNNSQADPYAVTVTGGATNATADFGFFGPGGGTISGIVWLDPNNNSTIDGGETIRIANTAVRLTITYASGATTTLTTLTGADGSYSFTNLLTGEQLAGGLPTFSVTFDPPGGYAVSAGTPLTQAPAPAFTWGGSTPAVANLGLRETQAVTGRVWVDLDADGTQDAGEPNLSGVTVRVYRASNNNLTGTATTDAYGEYAFEGIAARDYYVNFTLPGGYVFSPQGGAAVTAAGDSNANVTTGTTPTFTLATNTRVGNVDAGMYQRATIGDFVWEDLNANGMQDPGEPGLAGVSVQLQTAAGASVGAPVITTGTGAFSFASLTPGIYRVQYTLPAGYFFSPAVNSANTALDSNPNSFAGQVGTTPNFTVSSGQAETSIDAGAYRQAALAGTAWVDTNGNGVQDSGEPALAGVSVQLKTTGGVDIGSPVTTGADGSYAFNPLTPGSYTVAFTAPGGYTFTLPLAGADRALDSDPASFAGPVGTTGAVTLTSGQTDTSVDAGFYQPVTIGDFVWEDANGNGLQDLGEPGLPGVSVQLKTAGGANVGAPVTTDANGAYSISAAPGSYTVDFTAPAGYAFTPALSGPDRAIDSDPNVIAGQTGTTAAFTLTSGQTDPTVDAGLYRAVSFGGRAWTDLDAGGAQDPGELGLAGVIVTLYDKDGAEAGVTTTGADGSYTFSGLVPGDYSVAFTRPDGTYSFSPANAPGTDSTTDSDADPTTGRTSTVTLASGGAATRIDAGLWQMARIDTRVWDDLNSDGIQDPGEPGLAGVSVQLKTSGGANVGAPAATDANGEVSFQAAPGSYTLAFTPAGGYEFTQALAGSDPAVDSNANPVSGLTGSFTLVSGQVESSYDAGMKVTTTAVAVTDAAAASQMGRVRVSWRTVSEVEIVGFNILRSEGGAEAVKLNGELIVAQNAGQLAGGGYAFADLTAARGASYTYTIEIVTTSGETVTAGPFSVTVYGNILFLPGLRR